MPEEDGVAATEAENVDTEQMESQEEVDVAAALRQELQEANARAQEYLDGWQRARAEFSNYKRRQEQERDEQHKRANESFMRRLVPAVDDFERAFHTLPYGLMSLTWIDGIALIKRKLEAALEAEGLSSVAVEPGQAFDPLLQQAITREEHVDFEDGQVIAEVQKGYMLGDRLLRPTLVRVSSGPPSEAAKETLGDGGDEEASQ